MKVKEILRLFEQLNKVKVVNLLDEKLCNSYIDELFHHYPTDPLVYCIMESEILKMDIEEGELLLIYIK